jgi:outer membrane lipoprotein LolB
MNRAPRAPTRRASIAAACCALAACAHQPDGLDDGFDFSERQSRISAVADWDLRGRMTVATPERSHRAGVRWQQRGDRLELTVRGLLGARSFRIEGGPESLTVTEGGDTRILNDPEVELSREFGWWLPVTSLEYWVLGQPDADFELRSRRGADGTLRTLDQRDWLIRYEEYQLAAGLLVPRTIILRHDTLELTLNITRWEPVAAEP